MMAYITPHYPIKYKNYDIAKDNDILTGTTLYHVCMWNIKNGWATSSEYLATFNTLEDAIKYVKIHETTGA